MKGVLRSDNGDWRGGVATPLLGKSKVNTRKCTAALFASRDTIADEIVMPSCKQSRRENEPICKLIFVTANALDVISKTKGTFYSLRTLSFDSTLISSCEAIAHRAASNETEASAVASSVKPERLESISCNFLLHSRNCQPSS